MYIFITLGLIALLMVPYIYAGDLVPMLFEHLRAIYSVCIAVGSMIKYVILVSVMAAVVVGPTVTESKRKGRIFNGSDAVSAQFKFMALIIARRVPESICGGAIIRPKWVLTAAHCVEEAAKVEVYLGIVHLDNAEVAYLLRRKHIFVHPEWDHVNIMNDVALLRIPLTKNCNRIAYASLPYQWAFRPLNVLSKWTAVGIGWGQKGNTGPLSNRLQWTLMEIIRNDECKKTYYDIDDRNICAKTTAPYGSTCEGDSGGPVLLGETSELIGISSSIEINGCENGEPVFLMRISSYLPWITEVTRGHR